MSRFWILVALAVMAAPSLAIADVPTNLNIQGRLTDSTGAPLPVGLKIFTFKIYDAASAGTQIWPAGAGEDQTLSTDEEGLWDACVGEVIPLPSTVFKDTARWLEIVVDDGINPAVNMGRLKLKTAPYAFRAASSQQADSLEGNTFADLMDKFVDAAGDTVGGSLVFDFGLDGNPDLNIVEATGPSVNLSMSDNDSLKTFIWGEDWGELSVYDADGHLAGDLNATSASGGRLALNREDGSTGVLMQGGTTSSGSSLSMVSAGGSPAITLNAGLTGDAAVNIPNSSIHSLEIANEPGVASDDMAGETGLTTSIGTYATASIVAPAAGYALVTGTMYFRLVHTTGTSTIVFFDVSDTLNFFTDSDWLLWQSNLPSGTRIITQTIHRVYPVSAGTNTFYITARNSSGSADIGSRKLSVIYIPTAYGTVDPPTVAVSSGNTDASRQRVAPLSLSDVRREIAQAESEQVARIQAELDVLKAERELVAKRLQAVESELNTRAQARASDR